MNREGSRVFFTDEDKKHIIVKKYIDSEVENNRKRYKNGRNVRRIVFFIILFATIVASFIFESIQFAAYITIVFVIFLILLYEYIDIINLKAASRLYYVEASVEKKLSIETCVEGTLTPGSDVSSLYPIEGLDTTSGYKSIYYIDKEQYKNTKIGEKVRISVAKEKL